MKRLIALLVAAFVLPVMAMADGWQVQPGANTPRALNTPGVVMERANVDNFGNQGVFIQSYKQTPVPFSPALSVTTPVAMITILPTALPTAFGTPQFANAAALKSVTVDNSGDQDIWCAYAGGTAANFRVPPGSVFYKNFGAFGDTMNGAIGCIHPANTPSTGTVVIYGEQ